MTLAASWNLTLTLRLTDTPRSQTDDIFVHITRDGTKIPLSQLSDNHLRNIIALIERKAQEGIMVRHGGGVPPDAWYEEYRVCGDEALALLNYNKYIAEMKRRAEGENDCVRDSAQERARRR